MRYVGTGVALLFAVAIGYLLGQSGPQDAAAQDASPVKAKKSRDVYYPGTEDLAPDEMRIVACGTGQPSVRPKQAAACFLVELGNGDKFLFDIGSGSHERIAAQKIPYDYIDKVFIGHLHVDHFGDLPSFWLGGTVMNRLTPLRVWGPSGATPEFGTKRCMELMEKMYAWDIGTRAGFVDFRGGQLEVHEFDYKGVNQVIYDENGVVIRSIPAIHAIDGAVSFILEWNGLKLVYGSDTYPNKWYREHAKGADVAIHECFLPATLLVTKQGFTPLEGLNVGTQAHTSPEQFGKVMSLVKPRLAIGFHFYNDFDIAPEVRRRILKTYDGPLSLERAPADPVFVGRVLRVQHRAGRLLERVDVKRAGGGWNRADHLSAGERHRAANRRASVGQEVHEVDLRADLVPRPPFVPRRFDDARRAGQGRFVDETLEPAEAPEFSRRDANGFRDPRDERVVVQGAYDGFHA
ncbi:MAG: guanitoxin biosynthesis MBL fold metallo-hydrolase GntH [Planctomycetota bacterium]